MTLHKYFDLLFPFHAVTNRPKMRIDLVSSVIVNVIREDNKY